MAPYRQAGELRVGAGNAGLLLPPAPISGDGDEVVRTQGRAGCRSAFSDARVDDGGVRRGAAQLRDAGTCGLSAEPRRAAGGAAGGRGGGECHDLRGRKGQPFDRLRASGFAHSCVHPRDGGGTGAAAWQCVRADIVRRGRHADRAVPASARARDDRSGCERMAGGLCLQGRGGEDAAAGAGRAREAGSRAPQGDASARRSLWPRLPRRRGGGGGDPQCGDALEQGAARQCRAAVGGAGLRARGRDAAVGRAA